MSQFILVALDATDEGALERRMTHRPAHLEAMKTMRAEGKMLCGLALTGANDKMIGSVIIANFESRAEFDAWLHAEPFYTAKVWGDITVHTGKLAPIFADLLTRN